jgi:preprotein translocase subunit SecG
LYKLTSGLAIGFFITSIFLAYLATSETTVSPSGQKSIMSEVTTIEAGLPVSDIPSN